MIRKNNFYRDSKLFSGIKYADDAVRAAIRGEYDILSEMPELYGLNGSFDSELTEILLQVALAQKDDILYGMLAKYTADEKMIFGTSPITWEKIYMMQYIRCCFDGTPFQIKMLFGKIKEHMSDYFSENGSELFESPVYWLMVSGAYKKINDADVLRETGKGNAHCTFVSAVINKECGFLELMFENGYTLCSKDIADLICRPDDLVWLAREYKDYFPNGNKISAYELKAIINVLDEELLTEAAGLLYVSSSASDNVPDISSFPYKISKIWSSDLKKFLDQSYDLVSLFASELTVYVNELDEMILYDIPVFSKIEYVITSEIFWYDSDMALRLLDRNIRFENEKAFYDMLISLLSFRSDRVLKKLLKKGLINMNDLDTVIQYLNDSRQVKAVRIINSFFNKKN